MREDPDPLTVAFSCCGCLLVLAGIALLPVLWVVAVR